MESLVKNRQQLEKEEENRLAPYAVKSRNSRGRKYDEKEDDYRLSFQRDRDRIIHSKAFRRLKAKTQVFIEHYGDHFRTRLTHTLEVAQISRDIARSLGLNEDLAEAIALAHDLGHTPFGHMGEEALSACLQLFGLHFEHNEQSRRIVSEIEHQYPDFHGLNLTEEVLEGLMKHQSPWDHPVFKERKSPSLEAQVVNLSDEIAYHNHDIDDGLRSGILTYQSVQKLTLFHEACELVKRRYEKISDESVQLSRIVSQMISLMIYDLYSATQKNLAHSQIKNLKDVYNLKKPVVSFTPEMAKRTHELKDFLTERLYFHPRVHRRALKGKKIIRKLFEHYVKNPHRLPDKLKNRIEKGEQKAEIVRDFIAGMTDTFAEDCVRDCK
ncbi:deoxyguanosinetriphosphate triphosphohydrolase [Candidatus Peregrinibacteria bacterium]|nr:deoxyguanosinetriphosphate triphosphohydrolase [Candidatus Peregrinibacteria bacterium]